MSSGAAITGHAVSGPMSDAGPSHPRPAAGVTPPVPVEDRLSLDEAMRLAHTLKDRLRSLALWGLDAAEYEVVHAASMYIKGVRPKSALKRAVDDFDRARAVLFDGWDNIDAQLAAQLETVTGL